MKRIFAGVAWALLACACVAVEDPNSAGADRGDGLVQLVGTLYVWRGACPEPGKEDPDAKNVVVQRQLANAGSESAYSLTVPFLAVAQPPGPLGSWCARTVYTASWYGGGDAGVLPADGGAWAPVAYQEVRLAHQDSRDPVTVAPFAAGGDQSIQFGELVGDDPKDDLHLYDADGDGIPNLREIQLNLRPTVVDSMELPAAWDLAPVALGAVTAPLGVDGGYGSEGPQVDVPVAAISMDTLEVTNRQYRVCMGLVRNGSWACLRPEVVAPNNVLLDNAGDGFPVVGVTHQQAQDFCRMRTMDLPTEVEWERAARVQNVDAAHPTTYPFGNDEPMLDAMTGQNTCSLGRFLQYADSGLAKACGFDRDAALRAVVKPTGETARDRSLQNNRILDLAGSVAEWALDPWDRDLHEHAGVAAPATTATAHIFPTRGGSFRSGPRFVRSYARVPVDDNQDSTRVDTLLAVGFRCVAH